MSKEGLEALLAEIERLETVERPAIVQQIKTAREFGDLKENAEYHAAKDAQSHLETRIKQLREQAQNATVVEPTQGGDVVGFGSTVEVQDDAGDRRLTYRLVAAHEAAPSEGRLSYESPVGAALRDKRVGDVAIIATPRGERRLTIVAIS